MAPRLTWPSDDRAAHNPDRPTDGFLESVRHVFRSNSIHKDRSHSSLLRRRLSKATSAFEEMSTKDKDMLRTRCEVAKCEMATRQETEILLFEYAGRQLDFLVTREWFERLVSPFVEQAIEQLVDAVREARISYEDVGALVVIGGTSNLRLLREPLKNSPIHRRSG